MCAWERLTSTKKESSRLRSGLRIDAQRVRRLPRDVKATGQAHDASGAITLALLAVPFIVAWIPGRRDPPSRGVERHVIAVAARRRGGRLPVAGDVEWRSGSSVERDLSTSLEHDKQDCKGDFHCDNVSNHHWRKDTKTPQ